MLDSLNINLGIISIKIFLIFSSDKRENLYVISFFNLLFPVPELTRSNNSNKADFSFIFKIICFQISIA